MAIPRPHTAVIEGEFLHEARREASEAGAKTWREGRRRVNNDTGLVESYGCVGCERMFIVLNCPES